MHHGFPLRYSPELQRCERPRPCLPRVGTCYPIRQLAIKRNHTSKARTQGGTAHKGARGCGVHQRQCSRIATPNSRWEGLHRGECAVQVESPHSHWLAVSSSSRTGRDRQGVLRERPGCPHYLADTGLLHGGGLFPLPELPVRSRCPASLSQQGSSFGPRAGPGLGQGHGSTWVVGSYHPNSYHPATTQIAIMQLSQASNFSSPT